MRTRERRLRRLRRGRQLARRKQLKQQRQQTQAHVEMPIDCEIEHRCVMNMATYGGWGEYRREGARKRHDARR